MIRRVIGCDPSFTGFGLADHDRAIAVAAEGEGIRERCRSLYVAIAKFIEPFADEPMLWVVEQPMLSERNLLHLLNMGHLMSHVYDLAESLADVDVQEVHAGRLKIFAAGRGNANKTELAVSVFERWGVRFDGDGGGNKCDAFALYQFGLAWMRGENPGVRPPKPKKQRGAA